MTSNYYIRKNKAQSEGKCYNCGKENRDMPKVCCEECRKKRSEYQKIKGKESHRRASQKYKKNNRAKIQEYENNKRRDDPYTRIIHCLRERIRQLINGVKKPIKTLEGIGCTKKQLVQHIENQWLEGMSWENYGFGPGKWNIDHIYPFHLCDKNNLEEIIRNNHYTNLRPMWFEDNMNRKYEEFK